MSRELAGAQQKAIDHANRAVKNLRKNMSMGATVAVDGKEAIHVQATVRAQQKDMLQLWEYIAAKLTIPEDPTIENVHYQNTVTRAENAQLRDDLSVADTKIEMLLDRITRFRHEEEGVNKLREAVKIQSSPGNYDVNEYMRGYANGLILALSIMTNSDPKFFEAPSAEDKENG